LHWQIGEVLKRSDLQFEIFFCLGGVGYFEDVLASVCCQPKIQIFLAGQGFGCSANAIVLLHKHFDIAFCAPKK
jgi:hypothetical protein